MTEELRWPEMTEAEREQYERQMRLYRETGWVCGVASEDGRTMIAYNDKTHEIIEVRVEP